MAAAAAAAQYTLYYMFIIIIFIFFIARVAAIVSDFPPIHPSDGLGGWQHRRLGVRGGGRRPSTRPAVTDDAPHRQPQHCGLVLQWARPSHSGSSFRLEFFFFLKLIFFTFSRLFGFRRFCVPSRFAFPGRARTARTSSSSSESRIGAPDRICSRARVHPPSPLHVAISTQVSFDILCDLRVATVQVE